MNRAICFVLATVVVLPFAARVTEAQAQLAEAQPRQLSRDETQLAFQQMVAGLAAAFGTDKPRPEPKQPEWVPLEPKTQEWVDQVLDYWEKRSGKVKTLEFTFQKWEYDPQVIPGHVKQLRVQGQLEKMPFTRYSSGVIKYAAPDKELFRVDRLQVIDPGLAGDPPKYSMEAKENRVHRITNGKSCFFFDGIRKEVLEMQLPPEWQGQPPRFLSPFQIYWSELATFQSPLVAFQIPSGDREAVQARFWIRPLQAEAKGEYCLEFMPKSRQDRRHFHSLQIVIDEREFLPVKLQVFESDWSPENPHRTAYKFDKWSVNGAKFDVREFTEVKTPIGWRRIVRDANGNLVSVSRED